MYYSLCNIIRAAEPINLTKKQNFYLLAVVVETVKVVDF